MVGNNGLVWTVMGKVGTCLGVLCRRQSQHSILVTVCCS